MKSMQYHYWSSQCEKGFKLEDDDENYEYLADETLYIDNYIWVYKVDIFIYAIKYKDSFDDLEVDYDHYILN